METGTETTTGAQAQAGAPARSALIVGASRGLGFAIAGEYLGRGWNVIGTARAGSGGKLRGLAGTSAGRCRVETLDVTEAGEVASLRAREAGWRLDLLFVNAGVMNEGGETIGEVSTEEFVRVMVTNALGPMRVIERFEDLVTPDGIIGVMSSGLGSVANNQSGGYEVYRASKAALNTLMRSFAARHAGGRRTFLVMAPGWVRTDMGGPGATLSVEQSIPNLVTTMEAQRGKPGVQYLDYLGRAVPW